MYPIPGAFRQWVSRLRQDPVAYDIVSTKPTIQAIHTQLATLQTQSDEALRQQFRRLQDDAHRGASPEAQLTEIFALVSEAAWRTSRLRPYDVQLAAAIVMHQGRVAEMQTGEGKTLAAILPATLHALSGRGVHILTFNDYLVKRDARWMGEIFRFFGLSVGAIAEGMTTAERKAAWSCDITYATARETGFDFLRDQLVLHPDQLVHRPFHFAIVDEADSILIDEARVPLVIAGDFPTKRESLHRVAQLTRDLLPEVHYNTDEFQRNVFLTEQGQTWLEQQLGCDALHAEQHRELLAEVQVALHAHTLLKKDVDYVVRDGEIVLVDEFTGRLVHNRKWPDGLQAALEAKEGLEIQPEGRVLGSITLQHLMRRYPKLAGMTGTARPAQQEFHTFYQMPVTVIPTHHPCIRLDQKDKIFSDKETRLRALTQTLRQSQERGRPVLVGTSSVKESESLSAQLKESGIPHHVLNARNNEQEAAIIAEAGKPGAITISTNMAGRGVDIRLGGADEHAREQVMAQGGLLVLGTQRHESIRIDYQLRGRAGRQGEPGETRFFLSLEDELMTRFGLQAALPTRLRPKRGTEIDNPAIQRQLEQTQRIIEGQNFTIRQTLFKYSAFVEQQRELLHEHRHALLLGEEEPSYLAEEDPKLYADLSKQLGATALVQHERDVTIKHMDTLWAAHLAHIADIREGVHLQSAGGIDPFTIFCQQATETFDAMYDELPKRVRLTFRSATIKDGTLVLSTHEQGLERPASTWTYLIHDETFERGLTAFFHAMGKAFLSSGSLLLRPWLLLGALWGRLKRLFANTSTEKHPS